MRTLLIAAALLLFAGCDSGVTGDSTFFGSYVLKTVNGSSVPASANGIEYLDGVITLTEAGTYSEDGHIRVTANGQTTTQTISEVGSYVFLGTSVTLTSANGAHTRISLIDNSNKMTIVEAGVTLVYRK